jgi:hypothetical protein
MLYHYENIISRRHARANRVSFLAGEPGPEPLDAITRAFRS